MTALELIAAGHVAATLIVGFGQIAIVAIGIRAMNRASDERAKDRLKREQRDEQRRQQDEQRRQREEQRDEQRRQQDEQRHAEAMRRLDEHGASLAALIRQSDASAAALRESTAALREVVARTAPAAD